MTYQTAAEARAAYKAAVTSVMTGEPLLAATDRCDRCGARAMKRVEVAPGLELLFCAHHHREHRDALEAKHAVTTASAPDAV